MLWDKRVQGLVKTHAEELKKCSNPEEQKDWTRLWAYDEWMEEIEESGSKRIGEEEEWERRNNELKEK